VEATAAAYDFLADNVHPLLGLGIGYNLTRHVRLELADTAYLQVGSGAASRGHYEGPTLNPFTIGVSYRF
jgi:hypothetical protein